MNFRKTAMKYYGLEVCSFYTTPSLSYDAMYKMTGVKLQVINDSEIYDFIKRGIRGGIAQVGVKEANANNIAFDIFQKRP